MLIPEISVPLAFVLDHLFGDPHWLPHPVRAMGGLALGAEAFTRKYITNLYAAGSLSVVLVLLATGGFVSLLIRGAAFNSGLQTVVQLYLLYSCLAARDLARHSVEVYRALAVGDLDAARNKVAMIVGRETGALDEQGVGRACVESVAESLVDGVTAPLFWGVIAGPIGAMLYKAVNTMDSIFGYKNERYLKFGTAAARLDDLLNFIPARLTALAIIGAAAILGLDFRSAFRIWWRDRRCHASPNSGQSEAAVAGALGLQLGGTSIYFGKAVAKPTIGDNLVSIKPFHIVTVNRLMYSSAIILLMLLVVSRFIFSYGVVRYGL